MGTMTTARSPASINMNAHLLLNPPGMEPRGRGNCLAVPYYSPVSGQSHIDDHGVYPVATTSAVSPSESAFLDRSVIILVAAQSRKSFSSHLRRLLIVDSPVLVPRQFTPTIHSTPQEVPIYGGRIMQKLAKDPGGLGVYCTSNLAPASLLFIGYHQDNCANSWTIGRPAVCLVQLE